MRDVPEALRRTLERTGFRASLSDEYLTGRAPAVQAKGRRQTSRDATYYGLAAIKKPDWLWYIWAYFFVGGVGSGAYVVATLADIRGREEDRAIVRAGRFLALAGMLLSPILLVLDLGRKERWLNMLRVFRPRSMMNVGSFALVMLGAFSGLAAAVQLLQDLAPRRLLVRAVVVPLRLVSWLGIVPAVVVGSYTGLLLAATNVPLWARNRLFIGPLFLSSSLSTAMAAIDLLSGLFGSVSKAGERRLKQAETQVLTAELALTLASVLALRGLARPLVAGRVARVYQIGSIGLGMLVPLGLSCAGVKSGPGGKLASVLVLVGGLIMRWAVTRAGLEQADDPRAYFQYTRADSERL